MADQHRDRPRPRARPSNARSRLYRKIIAAAPDAPVATQARSRAGGDATAARERERRGGRSADGRAGEDRPPGDSRSASGSASPPRISPARIRRRRSHACSRCSRIAASPHAAEARARGRRGAHPAAGSGRRRSSNSRPFRDDEKLRNIAGVSDRALLRLGHASRESGQWDASRQTHRGARAALSAEPVDRRGALRHWLGVAEPEELRASRDRLFAR